MIMLNSFLKLVRKYEMMDDILWLLCYSQGKGEDVKENIKLFIESKKFNVQNTVRDVNIIFKMMYEIRKICQLNYYPVLKLYHNIIITCKILYVIIILNFNL